MTRDTLEHVVDRLFLDPETAEKFREFYADESQEEVQWMLTLQIMRAFFYKDYPHGFTEADALSCLSELGVDPVRVTHARSNASIIWQEDQSYIL